MTGGLSDVTDVNNICEENVSRHGKIEELSDVNVREGRKEERKEGRKEGRVMLLLEKEGRVIPLLGKEG